MPAVGKIGPDFALFNQEEHVIPLGRVLNNADQLVIYFFPQPGSPGCTLEANGFRDIMPHLQARNVRVIGITTGSYEELKASAKANNLNFDLLFDADHRVSMEWGALRGEQSARVTFILNNKGVVTHHWQRVNVYTHGQEVLAALGGPVADAAPAAAPAAAEPVAAPAAPAPVAAVAPAAPAAPTAAPVQAAPAPVAVAPAPVAAAPAPVAAAPAPAAAPMTTAPADLVVATARAALQLLLAHQRSGAVIPQDVIEMAAHIALAAQFSRH